MRKGAFLYLNNVEFCFEGFVAVDIFLDCLVRSNKVISKRNFFDIGMS